MKLIMSVIMLGSVVAFAVSGSSLDNQPAPEGRVLLSDGLLTDADLDEIERRIEALPSLVPTMSDGAVAAK